MPFFDKNLDLLLPSDEEGRDDGMGILGFRKESHSPGDVTLEGAKLGEEDHDSALHGDSAAGRKVQRRETMLGYP